MIIALHAALALAVESQPAQAASVPASAAQTETKAERKICKREPIANSQYRTRQVCLTAAQWKAKSRGESIEDLSSVTTK